jgi:NAD-dependent dihydropyrimidine dehydrogenase PreA subunit
MTYAITSQCIACSRCESICPTQAITQSEQQYQINSERCNDCVGHYAVPQCWAVCPTNSGCVTVATLSHLLVAQPAHDYWDVWFNLYNNLIAQLKADHQSDYWQYWFDTYSRLLSQQLHTPTFVGVNA